MKRTGRLWCSFLTAAVCCVTLALPGAALEEESIAEEESGIAVDTSGDATYDVFTYRENDSGGIIITSCDTAATAVQIPTEIDGKPVTEIGDAAFISCGFLTSMEVPEGVTKIGESAFSSCSMLCTVSLPEGLTEIGKGAFESCSMLSEVQLPSTLTVLPDALFYNCSYLPSLELPDTVREIGNETFYSCTALTEITLPEGLEKIGDYAFQNCQELTAVALPSTCAELGTYVFDGCQALAEITVAGENPSYMAQDGVLFTADGTTLIRYPQARTETTYAVPEECETLADWSFIGATTLEQIDLGGVTEIGEDCFYYCTSLKEVTVPEGVTELKGAAFAYCMAMERITLPSTMETLGNHCFYSCAVLTDINIPEGVTTLGDQCFYNCVALLDLTLPSSITEIGDQAVGYYTPSTASDSSEYERIDLLKVHNQGSSAVAAYLRSWKTSSYAVWIIVGAVVLGAAVLVAVLVLVHRHRNRIRPTSRHAAEHPKGKKKAKKR